jgi:hypothetical protein
MRSKLVSVAIGATLTISLLGATGASAATEAGNRCLGNAAQDDLTLYGVANAPGDPLSATIPVDGVISRWNFNIIPIPSGFISQTLKILRATGVPNQFQVIGESSQDPISGGLNTFSTRIPVHTGDSIGTTGKVEGEDAAVYCNTGNPGERLGVIAGNPPLNSTAISEMEVATVQVPITVSIEPDIDKDGYGDETQDQCPQSATTQAVCPVVSLSLSATKTKKLVTVAVTGTTAADVTVNGTASLGKGKKAKIKGGTKAVAPGALTKFKLKFPAKLIKRLKELPPSKGLRLKITSSAPNLAAAPTKKVLKLKLKGQGPKG